MLRALLLLLPLAAAPPGDAGEVTLTPDTEARWVGFALTPAHQIRFVAQLDGRPVEAVLDTGASRTLLAASAALHPTPDGSAITIGGSVAIGSQPVGAIVVGGLRQRGGDVAVGVMTALATGGDPPVALLLGTDVIAHAALEIDYAARRFRFLPSGRLPFTGAVAPLRLSPDRRLFESELTLGGHRIAPAIVDTGDGGEATLSAAAWAAAAPPGVRTTDALTFGVAGRVVTMLAIVPTLAVGAAATREVELRVEPAGGFNERVGAAARIGGGLLARYHVLLDPGAGRMVLAPNLDPAPPPARSTAGLLLGVGADRLTVVHVMRGSPGAMAGWRVGETICRVDGQAVGAGYAAGASARWTVGRPGTIVRLGLCDGGERVLTLSRFY